MTNTEATLANLRALYASVRADREGGFCVDTNHVTACISALPQGADRDRVCAAFDALLGKPSGYVERTIAETIETMRRNEEKVRAGFRAEAKARAAAKAKDARREAARLARETAATVMEW